MCTVEPEYPIQDIHALFDTDQAERAAAPAPLRHADAVVADAHGNPAPFDAQFNADLARLGMPRNIAERFLQDAEQGGGALLAHAHFAVRFDQLALGARAAAELLDLPLDCGTQAQVEYARPQVVDDLAHAADGGVDLPHRCQRACMQTGLVPAGAPGQHVRFDT